MDRSRHSGSGQQIIEIVFPRGQFTDSVVACRLHDGDVLTYRDSSGLLWLLDGELSADWISLAALVDETISAGADVAVFSVAAWDSEESKIERDGIVMIREDWMHRILADDCASRCLAEVGIANAAMALDPAARILEWSKDEKLQRHFHPDYPNCGETEVVPGIRFPVADAAIHAATCGLYLDLADRMGGRVSRYQGEKTRGWFLEDCERWQEQFGMEGAAKVLEIGATDGVNTNALLDLLFAHPQSEVHAIRSEEPDAEEDFFEDNAVAGGHEGQVNLYQGEAVEILAWMISTEGFWESFDFIHLRLGWEPLAGLTAACQGGRDRMSRLHCWEPPAGLAAACQGGRDRMSRPHCREPVADLTAACQAWALLKPGGAMVVDFSGRASLEDHPALHAVAGFIRTSGGGISTIGSTLTALRKGGVL